MSNSLNQDQRAGDHSTNVQAQRVEVHHHHGPPVAEVMQTCMALFQDNFIRLQAEARRVAEERATEITGRFLDELVRRNPAGLESARDPDMQYAIFTAQREYARSGREDLEQLLVALLVQRTGAKDLKQIVLNEAIKAAALLTPSQLDTLSFLLIFVHSAPLQYTFHTMNDFAEYLRRYISPLLNESILEHASVQHLKYTGCVSMDSGGVPITEWIRQAFPGCFAEGFDPAFATSNPTMQALNDVTIPSFHVPGALQIIPMDRGSLRRRCAERAVSQEDADHLFERASHSRLLIDGLLQSIDIKFGLIAGTSYHAARALSDVQLTTVGIALANANLKHRVGLDFDLGYWIA